MKTIRKLKYYIIHTNYEKRAAYTVRDVQIDLRNLLRVHGCSGQLAGFKILSEMPETRERSEQYFKWARSLHQFVQPSTPPTFSPGMAQENTPCLKVPTELS